MQSATPSEKRGSGRNCDKHVHWKASGDVEMAVHGNCGPRVPLPSRNGLPGKGSLKKAGRSGREGK